MATGSLRLRLTFGALLAGAGLIALAVAAAVGTVHRYPHFALMVHNGLIAALAIVIIGVAWVWLRSSLSPVVRLQGRIADVREGRARRVDGEYPDEVDPMVHELNALLDDRERRVARALAKAGDLAHGLKTPLAVLAREAERARAAGLHELADTLDAQIERMRRQITYHLAHARAAASGATLGARTGLRDAAEALVRTLARLHGDRGVTIGISVDAALAVRVEREDLDEMLGNLLDNACAHARARVELAARTEGTRIAIVVDDDGPGLAPELREAVLHRGVRADGDAPGSGIGLAIVKDLAELYGGSVVLTASPQDGLRARLELPAA